MSSNNKKHTHTQHSTHTHNIAHTQHHPPRETILESMIAWPGSVKQKREKKGSKKVKRVCALFGFWLCVCFLLLFPLLDIFEGFFAKASAPAHVCRFLQFRPPLFSSSSSSPLFHCFLCSSSLRQSNKAWTSPGPRHRECSPVWLTRTVLFCLSNTSRRSCNHCLCLCVVSPTYFFFFL